MDSSFKSPSKLPALHEFPSGGSFSPFTPKRSRIKRISNDEINSVSRSLIFDENIDSPFKTPSKLPEFQELPSSGSSSPFTPKISRIKRISNDEINSVSRSLIFDENMDSPFKTPSKTHAFQELPSSGSSSPFTPKRSRIKRISTDEINSVSQSLIFDDSHRRSPFDKNLESSPSQQALPCKDELIKSEQTTPIKTEQTCINKILVSPSIKNHPKRFNIDEQAQNAIKPSPKKRNYPSNFTLSKRFKSNGSKNCKLITQFFKPIQKRTNFILNKNNDDILSAIQKKSNGENMNPKFEIVEESRISTNNNEKKKCQTSKDFESSTSKKNVTKQLNFATQVTPTKSKIMNNTPMKSPRIMDYLENKVEISGGDTYSRFIKSIVFKPEIFCLGKRDIMSTIENCSDEELKIYGRLIARKHDWIRSEGTDGINKYRKLNLCNDFDSILLSLETKQLISTDVTSCELDCLLNILKAPELKELQKTFNINLISSKSKTKPEMIKSFINLVKRQRTFCGNSITNLKACIKKKLGYCLKLSDTPRNDIMSCIIYESYPYFTGEEKDRFRDCFTKFASVEKKELKFPSFNAKRVSVIFNSEDNLEMYKIALNLRHEVQLSLEQKDHENAIIILKVVFEKFKSAVNDKCLVESFSKLPTYLRKYTAISVYAYTLFKNISILKKSNTDKDLAKDVLEFLLQHKEFLISKKPDLHIELAKVFESQYKQINLAAKEILNGLKDDTMSELGRQMLSNRAMIYADRKVRKLDHELKEELLRFTTVKKNQLPSTTISGKIISVTDKVSTGRKQVYSRKFENGDILYMSVEELALSHYKSQGYLNGIHDEGQFIKSMFLLCFWDIIYDSYPPHVLFISQYQDSPLDWRTHHFYNIREQRIQDRMIELKLMNIDQICDMLKTRCDEYYETQSVVNWKFINVDNLPMCKTLLECVGIELFLAIGNQILKDGRIYLYGMPDLIVWDTVNQKCIFVEVKGPKDKLSERQTSWLFKLIEFGANVEVCHVVGNGGKTNDFENID